ncbi:MAG: polysaccharide lyase [Verrucomicrobiae bacterium]|nr:polysaccharide lyase [Verrucomicrobiae bacterium]
MKTKPMLILPAVAVVLLLAGVMARRAAAIPARTITPPDESEVELTATEKGVTYKLYRAALWRVDARSGRWEFIQQMYDPDFYAKNYVERDGVVCRKTADGNLVPVRRRFADDFEHAKPVRELIGLDTGWTAFTLQSPKAPSVSDYVRLRKRILQGQSDFLDNRVELAADIVHSGRRALKTYSAPPSRSMVCAKASLDTELLHFVKGDDVWFSGWYYVPEGSGMPFTVMDLETSWIREYPGIRIMLADGKHAMFELKWGGKPKYRQSKGKEVVFPVAKWVHLKARLRLSEKQDGIAELWQDGVKIVDARGQTLPLAHTIYNSLEIGITAHNDRDKPATLYVDDVAISDKPLELTPASP